MAETESRFFALSNLVAQQAVPVVPWEFQTQVPESAKSSKDNFLDWVSQPGTRHCLYSAVEGMVSGLRVSEKNHPHAIHAVVVDYDTTVGEDLINRIRMNCPGEFTPNWVHKSFSGGARLIWQFDEPALVPNMEFAEQFLEVAVKKLKAKKFLPGMDDVYKHPHMYYEVGSKWEQLGTNRIPKDFVWAWLFEAGNLAKWVPINDPAVPIEAVAAEIEKRFPGRWTGDIAIGASGVRFWDPAADNSRGCVVRITGMQCFTGPSAFMSWGSIFGSAFIEKYKSSTIGAVMSDTWFDDELKLFWRRSDNGSWQTWAKDDFRLHLRVQYGLNPSKKPGRTASEVDEVYHAIIKQKWVDGARPYIYFPDGVIDVAGKKELNISTVKCLEPAEKGSVSGWGDNFPWLAEFFDKFFCAPIQRDSFLAWLQYAYRSGLELTPCPGQAVVIAGEVSRGKTLLTTLVVSPMLGGHADASPMFLGDAKFTHQVWTKPLLLVDDPHHAPAADQLRHARYSAMLKRVVANQDQTYERKFRSAGNIIWLGRTIITCNADPESIRLLPGLEISNRDKVSLYKCSHRREVKIDFPPRLELYKIIKEELPFFCRGLLDWEGGKKFAGGSRWGLKAFHDREMFDDAIQTGPAYSFYELLQIFLQEYSGTTTSPVWEGTVSKLLTDICMNDALKSLAARITPTSAGLYLGQLKSRGYGITQIRESRSGARTWRIPVSLVEEAEADENNEIWKDPKTDSPASVDTQDK